MVGRPSCGRRTPTAVGAAGQKPVGGAVSSGVTLTETLEKPKPLARLKSRRRPNPRDSDA